MATVGVTAGPKRAVTAAPLELSMLPAPLDYRRVDAFCTEFLTVPKGTGAGGAFRLRPWQRRIVREFYPARGRRPREGVVSLPRGNGKSALAAAIAVYALFADDEASPFVALVASDERQARIVFNAAVRMIVADERLAEQVQVYSDRLYVPNLDATLMPLPAEPGALQGWDPSLTIVDELHVVDRRVWEAMSLAAGKRERSLTLAISTPADSADSIMWSLVEHGRTNPEDEAFRLVEYAAPDGCDIDDRAAWKAANPALGDFLHVDALAATMRTTRPDAFRRYRLGQWVGGVDKWLPWGAWEACAANPGGPPRDRARVVLAFDGSASGDSTALVGATVERTPYVFEVGAWEAPATDRQWRVPRREVAARVAHAFNRWDVVELAADPWGWRSELEEWQSEHGRVVEFNTGHVSRMAPATDRAYAAIAERRVRHDGSEVITRHMANAVARTTPLGASLSKDKKHSPRKIDAAVAAVIALDRAAWHVHNRRRTGVAVFRG